MVETININNNINAHVIQTNKFKTRLIRVYLSKTTERENATLNALIPLVLKRGSENYKTQDTINKKLDYLYGAAFNYSVETRGDNSVLSFQINVINDKYKYDDSKENLLEEAMNILFDIIFNPRMEDNHFCDEYVESEKKNLQKLIEARIDDKRSYSMERCIEELYKGKRHGVSRIGYIEDLENINSNNLYEYYKKLIAESKIDIYFSGDFSDIDLKKMIKENKYLSVLEGRDKHFIDEKIEETFDEEVKTIIEKMDVTQGNLVLGLIAENVKDDEIALSVANAILGVGANSKLFQNVREKESLAYTAGSAYVQQKDYIVIRAGIEIKNYEKALKIIKEQVEMLKRGEFTQEEIDSAKKMLTAPLLGLDDEQGLEISYEFRNNINNVKMTKNERIEKIENVSKQEIIVAINKAKLKIVYFLRNE